MYKNKPKHTYTLGTEYRVIRRTRVITLSLIIDKHEK